MQKKLIALAVAAAFSAPAFADVTVYGVVDAAVARFSGDQQKSALQAVSGGLAQSRIGVTGAEDLNNGMKAVVKLEYGLDTETGSGLTTAVARQQMLALAGDMGTFATGYLQTAGYDWEVKFDPMAGSVVSPLQNVNAANFLLGTKAIAARAPRALAYISPNFSGFSFAVNYTTEFTGGTGNAGVSSSAADNKVTAYMLAANYDLGGLSVGGVYAKDSTPNGQGEKKDYALGASYDLSVVKLFATYQADKTTGSVTPAVAAFGSVDPVTGAYVAHPAVAAGTVAGPETTNKAMSVSAVAPVGPGAIAFSYAKNTLDGNARNAKGYTLAWLQGLSKTTTLYAALSKVDQDANAAYASVATGLIKGVAGGSTTLIAVGLNKKF